MNVLSELLFEHFKESQLQLFSQSQLTFNPNLLVFEHLIVFGSYFRCLLDQLIDCIAGLKSFLLIRLHRLLGALQS